MPFHCIREHVNNWENKSKIKKLLWEGGDALRKHYFGLGESSFQVHSKLVNFRKNDILLHQIVCKITECLQKRKHAKTLNISLKNLWKCS